MLGFEPDRLVEPAIAWKATALHLFCFADAQNEALAFAKPVYERLRANNIQPLPRYCDLNDYPSIVRNLRQVIAYESNSIVYLNAASGSKLFAMACAATAMLFESKMSGDGQLKLFYAKPKRYAKVSVTRPASEGFINNESIEVPIYHADLPDQTLIDALEVIGKNLGAEGELAYKEAYEKIYAKGILEPPGQYTSAKRKAKAEKAVKFVKFRNEIIMPLCEPSNPLIKICGVKKRRTIKLTVAGLHLLKIASDYGQQP